MNTTKTLSLALFVIALAACQAPDAGPAGTAARLAADAEADRQAIMQIDDAYEQAMQRGDAAAIIALHAGDAVVLPADQPALHGRPAIEAEFLNRYARAANVTLTTEAVHVADSGDLAFLIGSSRDSTGTGKYLTVFRRYGDGWQIVADIWNNDQPMAQAAAN
jgi:ketosteroid isomerase-like protein